MAKTGYKIDYMVRDGNADISDLLKIHQKVFYGNHLAVWKTATAIIVKVSNKGEVTGLPLQEAKNLVGYVEPKVVINNG